MRRGRTSRRRRRARSSAISLDGAWLTCTARAVGLSAVGTGHLKTIAAPGDGILARQRDVKALVEFRVPFELDREQIDDVERGANDSDWQPAKDAAQKIAHAEDRAIFEGYAVAGIVGIREGTRKRIPTFATGSSIACARQRPAPWCPP